MDYNAMLLAAERDSARATPERCAMFSEILTTLFAEYPPVCAAGDGSGPEYWRDEALCMLKVRGVGAIAAYWASDTGVPNELIDAAYTLLFT